MPSKYVAKPGPTGKVSPLGRAVLGPRRAVVVLNFRVRVRDDVSQSLAVAARDLARASAVASGRPCHVFSQGRRRAAPDPYAASLAGRRSSIPSRARVSASRTSPKFRRDVQDQTRSAPRTKGTHLEGVKFFVSARRAHVDGPARRPRQLAIERARDGRVVDRHRDRHRLWGCALADAHRRAHGLRRRCVPTVGCKE